MLSSTVCERILNNNKDGFRFESKIAMVSIPLSEYRNLVECKVTSEYKIKEIETVATERMRRNKSLSEQNKKLMDKIDDLEEKLKEFDGIISGTYFEEE